MKLVICTKEESLDKALVFVEDEWVDRALEPLDADFKVAVSIDLTREQWDELEPYIDLVWPYEG